MANDSIMVAAIDAGSNGIKMLIGEVDDHGTLWETADAREAVRLGHDAFTAGAFSERTLTAAVEAFVRFRKLIDDAGVTRLRAVGTSACRSAANAEELVKRIARETGLVLEVIDGMEEAQLVFTAVSRKIYLRDKDALLIDMGGGSVEVTVARGGRTVGWESLDIGPVRLLEQLDKEKLDEADAGGLLKRYAGAVEHLIEAELDGRTPDIWIGTGGNIKALGELRTHLCEKANPAKLKIEDLDEMIDKLLEMKPERRARRLRLRADRADIIAIAAIVLRMLLREARAARLLIPDVGLRQGVLHRLARNTGPYQTLRATE